MKRKPEYVLCLWCGREATYCKGAEQGHKFEMAPLDDMYKYVILVAEDAEELNELIEMYPTLMSEVDRVVSPWQRSVVEGMRVTRVYVGGRADSHSPAVRILAHALSVASYHYEVDTQPIYLHEYLREMRRQKLTRRRPKPGPWNFNRTAQIMTGDEIRKKLGMPATIYTKQRLGREILEQDDLLKNQPDFLPVNEDIGKHAMWRQFIHLDGRTCAFHHRLRIWAFTHTEAEFGYYQCTRFHAPFLHDGLDGPTGICLTCRTGKHYGGHSKCPVCGEVWNVEKEGDR